MNQEFFNLSNGPLRLGIVLAYKRASFISEVPKGLCIFYSLNLFLLSAIWFKENPFW